MNEIIELIQYENFFKMNQKWNEFKLNQTQ